VTRPLGVLLLLLAPLVPWSQSRIDDHVGAFRAQEEVLYLWTGEQVRNLFPGFEGLAADVYWLRTVQYFGGQRLFARERDFTLLRPLIEITTTLDPRLDIAYRYGAVFLSEPPPTGAGRPKEGIEVLEKGVRAMPESWRLRQNLGFFYYLYLGDAHRAAEILGEAAKLPGAAFWLRTLAADLLARGGDLAASRQMWQHMYEQAEEGILREHARYQLTILDSRDRARQLTAAVKAFEQRHGRRPRDLGELRRSGLWRGPLEDLQGVPFRYDASSGRVSISRESPLWRPVPPAAGG
jgi:tetratricopeptide (TPR) repeat protein